MSPGYLPFKDALVLPAWLCDNCGFWQRHSRSRHPAPLCLDPRHVVPQTGWRFWTTEEAEARFPCRWTETEPGIWTFSNHPVSGIGPSAYLVTTPGGNMMFEGCAVFSRAALDHVAALGGVDVLSASHPHSYGALWQIQDRFDPELALPAGDFGWSGALQVSWPYDDRLEPLPGLELHVTAGHFDGHAVLFDRERRILFCGDALKFELDPADPRRAVAISAHKAFVRGAPLTLGELRRYRMVFAPLDFRQTWTPFEQAANSGRAEALALIDEMLATRRTRPSGRSRAAGEPDDVARAPQAAILADAVLLHHEARAREPGREGPVPRRRPHGEDSAGPERRSRHAEPCGPVERIVRRDRHPLRPVVDVEEDGVVAAGRGRHQPSDVALVHRDPRIVEAAGEETGQRPARPREDRRHQLGHDHARVAREAGERGPERETEPEAADQHTSPGGQVPAGQPGHRLLRPVEARVHQFVPADPDRDLVSAPHQPHLAPAGEGRRIEVLPGNHRRAL